jgi:alginate O-acetyltransferase complex protein AlgI
VGLSYILFRVIHLLIDYKQGVFPRPSFLEYINYCFFFLNYVSGPIQRFDDFNKQIKSSPPTLTVPVLHAALNRIILGIFMMLVISGTASKLGTWLQDLYYVELHKNDSFLKSSAFLTFCIFLYLVNMYSNFSGYMHIIIGIGKICGFEIPENFNKPYLAKNFLDLWARWHITLSEWFKFYLFNPIMKTLSQRWDSPRLSAYFGAIAFFITFLVMGIWHGTTMLFFIYGILLGLAAMGHKIWQIFLTKKLGKKSYKNLCQREWYIAFSNGLTLSYFSFSLVCLWVNTDKIHENYVWKFILQCMVSLFVVCVIFMTIYSFFSRIKYFIVSLNLNDFLFQKRISEKMMIFNMAFKVAVIIYIVLVTADSAPEFIYKAF